MLNYKTEKSLLRTIEKIKKIGKALGVVEVDSKILFWSALFSGFLYEIHKIRDKKLREKFLRFILA